MKKPGFVISGIFLVIVLTILTMRYSFHQIKNINDKEQMTALRSLYRCCQMFYAEQGRAPRDGNELLRFCNTKQLGLPFVGKVSSKEILYFAMSDDRWVLVLLMPEANVKAVERKRKGDAFVLLVTRIKKGRVLQEEWNEAPAEMFRPPQKSE